MLWRRKPKGRSGVDRVTTLPSDVLVTICSFLPVSDVDDNVKLVCKTLRRECASAALWRCFCARTGKLYDSVRQDMAETDNTAVDNPFRSLYYRNPCVPADFPSIATALRRCPPQGSITLLPGVYEEHITIRKSLHIRAAFPEKGAAIVWYQGINEPCIAISGDFQNRVTVTLTNVQLLHSTDGADIWGGNCAIMVEGDESSLSLSSCSLQSDSGRGVVAVGGAKLHLQTTVIHDCAATGLYLGDSDSMASVKHCNIIRNGGGSRRSPPDIFDDDEDSDRVPAGHSGMYIEAGIAIVENSLVAGNSLTGLSVVRGGVVHIAGCDVTENGSDPILVEDDFDFNHHSRRRNSRRVRGGVKEGPVPNNYISRNGSVPSLEEELTVASMDVAMKHCGMKGDGSTNSRIVMGGVLRETPFDHVVERRMATAALESRYR